MSNKTILAALGCATVSLGACCISAEAVSLRYEGSGYFQDKVVGIDGLEVLGETYNVDFLTSTFDDAYSETTLFGGSEPGPLFLENKEGAIAASTAIATALGTTEHVGCCLRPLLVDRAFLTDNVRVPYSVLLGGSTEFVFSVTDAPRLGEDYPRFTGIEATNGDSNSFRSPLGPEVWAVFTPVSDGDEPIAVASATEPSLILGLITVSSLILGSRKKEKA